MAGIPTTTTMSVFMKGAIFSIRHFPHFWMIFTNGGCWTKPCCSSNEFGRTPDYNVNEGRDHYPKAFSCMSPVEESEAGRSGEPPMKRTKSLMGLPRYLTLMPPLLTPLAFLWMKLCSHLRVDLSPWQIRVIPYSVVLKLRFLVSFVS